jgi:hypothetical protein
MNLTRSLLTVLAATTLLGSGSAALAQTPAPYPPPPPPSAMAPNGEYVAPFAQQTQPAYVPQSVAMSGPRMIKDWDENQPIPHGYHPETRVRKGMVIGGAVVFGVPYLYSLLIASVGADVSGGGSNPVASLAIPVLGPFIEMGETSSSTAHFMLALDGAAQTAGAIMFIYGLTTPRNVLVRNDLAMTVVPMHLGKDGSGLGFVGRF